MRQISCEQAGPRASFRSSCCSLTDILFCARRVLNGLLSLLSRVNMVARLCEVQIIRGVAQSKHSCVSLIGLHVLRLSRPFSAERGQTNAIFDAPDSARHGCDGAERRVLYCCRAVKAPDYGPLHSRRRLCTPCLQCSQFNNLLHSEELQARPRGSTFVKACVCVRA